MMERPSGRVIYSGRNGSNERDFIDTVQMDQQDLAPTKAWDLDVPLDFGRADSGSDLPSFDGLLTSLQATRERGTPPLVATSPALLEDYCNKAEPFLPGADEFVPPFCGSLHPSIMPAHAPCGFQNISPLGSEDYGLASPHLAITDAGARSGRFSSISSAECSTIRANLPMLMGSDDVRPDGHLSDERQPLGGGPPAMANADLDEETDVLAKEHDSEEAPKADGSDSDYRPSARQTTRSRRAAARGRPPRRRISHYKGKEKKKVGRPITYKGDPEANDLTEEERRRIKRRIANRESARRVRQKRHDLMDDLQVNIEQMQGRNARLLAHCGRLEKQKAEVMGQVAEMQEKWSQAVSEGTRLHSEIATMRQTLELADVCRCMDVLIKQAAQQVNMRFMEKTGFNFQALQQQELLDPVPQDALSEQHYEVLRGHTLQLPPSLSSPFKTAFRDFASSVPLWT